MVFILIKSNLSISFFLNTFWRIVKHIFASSNFFFCWLHFQGQFGFCFIDEAKLIQSPFYSHSYPVNSVDPVNFSYCFRIVRFCPKFKCDCFWNIFYWCVCVCMCMHVLIAPRCFNYCITVQLCSSRFFWNILVLVTQCKI